MSCGCTDAARQGLGERDTERTGVCGYRPLRYSGVVTLLVVVGGEPVGGIGVPQALAAEVRFLLEDQGRRSAMQEDYSRLREMLGGGGASLKAARSMIEEIKP